MGSHPDHTLGHTHSHSQPQVTQDDGLKEELRKRNNYITRCIVSSAQLIGEKIDRQGGYAAGYDWCG